MYQLRARYPVAPSSGSLVVAVPPDRLGGGNRAIGGAYVDVTGKR